MSKLNDNFKKFLFNIADMKIKKTNAVLGEVGLSHTQIWVICLWAKVHKSVEFVHCVRATSGVSQRVRCGVQCLAGDENAPE